MSGKASDLFLSDSWTDEAHQLEMTINAQIDHCSIVLIIAGVDITFIYPL